MSAQSYSVDERARILIFVSSERSISFLSHVRAYFGFVTYEFCHNPQTEGLVSYSSQVQTLTQKRVLERGLSNWGGFLAVRFPGGQRLTRSLTVRTLRKYRG